MQTLENIKKQELTDWFDRQQVENRLFYTSVDLRYSGQKLVPVDTNIFPAGFNNLSANSAARASNLVREYFAANFPAAKSVMLLAENFSRNTYYHANLRSLASILSGAGLETKIYMDDATAASESGFLHTNYDVLEDVVVVNRDFTSGIPAGLKSVAKPVIPSPSFGWHSRRKNLHFDQYAKVAAEFAGHFGFDPWLITAYHNFCGKVDFKTGDGVSCIATNVDKLLFKISQKYAEYNIKTEPYVFIKSNSGTFGMGIMTVKSGAELAEINKKIRNKMSVIKEGISSTEVIIQEGVPTINEVGGNPAEPFVYLIGGQPVGAIMRINQNRDAFGNLNSAGMEFGALECSEINAPCEFSPMGIIARLATLAASREAAGLSVNSAA